MNQNIESLETLLNLYLHANRKREYFEIGNQLNNARNGMGLPSLNLVETWDDTWGHRGATSNGSTPKSEEWNPYQS